MVRVAKDLLRNLPGFVPWHIFLVNENPHELRNGDGWVRLKTTEIEDNRDNPHSSKYSHRLAG